MMPLYAAWEQDSTKVITEEQVLEYLAADSSWIKPASREAPEEDMSNLLNGW